MYELCGRFLLKMFQESKFIITINLANTIGNYSLLHRVPQIVEVLDTW